MRNTFGPPGLSNGRSEQSRQQARLDDITHRIETRKADTRAELERVGLLASLDALKAKFPIKASSFWLRTGRMEVGPEPRLGFLVPLTEQPIRPKGRGKKRDADRKRP